MRKGIKILGKVFSAAVLLLIIVPVALSLLLDIPAVQNYAVHRAACFVSRKLETTVSIDRVDIGIFSKVRVKGFYVEDYQRDTLLYVGKLDAFITSFGIFGGGLELSRGEIADARLYLRQTPGGEMNVKQIVDRISDPDKPKKGNFRLSLKKASIENMDLCLERLDHRDPEHGIDFSHMHLYGITARVDDFTIDGQAIYTSIAAFSARERSGFVLNHLAGRFYMTQGCLGFENASIITPVCIRISAKPYCDTIIISALPSATRKWVRKPASLTRYSRSRPMTVPQRPATHNRTIKFHSISISTSGFALQNSYNKFRHPSVRTPAAASGSAKHNRRSVSGPYKYMKK